MLDASSIAPIVAAAKAKHVILFTSDSDAPKSGRALHVAQATDEGLGDTIIDEMVKRVGEDAKIGKVIGTRYCSPNTARAYLKSAPSATACCGTRRRSDI